jgi:uncharacterized caspase-like protein
VNRLTSWDSHPHHLESTTVNIEQVLLLPLRESSCRSSLIFVDACASDLSEADRHSRDVLASMTTEEFERSLKETEHSSAAFFSCSPSQRSFSSPELKHGIWTYHLCRALSGKDSDAFARDRIVTTASLKDYLSHTVPKFIREKNSNP